jgi:hypothetical protein
MPITVVGMATKAAVSTALVVVVQVAVARAVDAAAVGSEMSPMVTMPTTVKDGMRPTMMTRISAWTSELDTWVAVADSVAEFASQ